MSLLALPSLLTSLRNASEDQLRAFLDGLHKELAPASLMENFLVEQMTQCIARLCKAGARDQGDGPIDAKWMRYYALNQRSFWQAYNEFQKNRRKAKAPAAADEATPKPTPTPIPTPAPRPIAQPTTAKPAAPPAPPAVGPFERRPPEARRREPGRTTDADRARWRDECLALMNAGLDAEPTPGVVELPFSACPAEVGSIG